MALWPEGPDVVPDLVIWREKKIKEGAWLENFHGQERGSCTWGRATRPPIVMPCCWQNPALTSKTNCAVLSDGTGVSEKGVVFAAMLTMVRVALMKMISRGRGVFLIQKDWGASRGNKNNMPWNAGRSRRYIRPKLRFVGVSAISTATRTGDPVAGYRVTWGRFEEAHADERARKTRKERVESWTRTLRGKDERWKGRRADRPFTRTETKGKTTRSRRFLVSRPDRRRSAPAGYRGPRYCVARARELAAPQPGNLTFARRSRAW